MFEVKELGDALNEIKINGEIDIYTAGSFKESVENAIDDGNKQIILDLSELSYIDSTGIGVLIELRKEGAEKNSTIVLKKPRKNIMKLFTLTGINQIFTITEGEKND